MPEEELEELDDHFDEILEEIIRNSRSKASEQRSLDAKRHSTTLSAILSGKVNSSTSLEELGVVDVEECLSFARHVDSRVRLGQQLFFSLLRVEKPTVGHVKAVVAKALQKRKVASGKVSEKKNVVQSKKSVTAKTEIRTTTDAKATGESASSSEGDDETEWLAPGFLEFEFGGEVKTAPTVTVGRLKVYSLVPWAGSLH